MNDTFGKDNIVTTGTREALERLKKRRTDGSGNRILQTRKELVCANESLEKDFTTKGAQGELKCPFAERAALRKSGTGSSLYKRPNSLPTPPDFKEQLTPDPIAAEFHIDDLGSAAASTHGLAAKCPIRFLDDHSPEEIAKYFENHKHEIPRSHEVCVKRYQSNAESIRQLDAKYGNLVNMIQGLGVKHQPMLASGDGKSSVGPPQRSSGKIEDWAEKCEGTVPPSGSCEEGGDEQGETRTSHFERPLQEVRLGESPSRPWGIQVPLEKRIAVSVDAPVIASDAAQSIPHSKPGSTEQAAPGDIPLRCPFGHDAPNVAQKQAPTTQRKLSLSNKASTASKVPRHQADAPSITFNGPVFFGYSSADAAEILKALQGSNETL